MLGERWLALIGWHAGAFKLRPRDEWIGWLPEQQFRRLQVSSSNRSSLVAVARIGQYHRRRDSKRLVVPVEQPHQLTLIVDLWLHLSRDDDLVLPIDRHLRVVALLEPRLLVFMIWLWGSVKFLCAFGSGSP